jgi:hypothetical protein
MNTKADAERASEIAAELHEAVRRWHWSDETGQDKEHHREAALEKAEWLAELVRRVRCDLGELGAAEGVDRFGCLDLARRATTSRQDSYGRPEDGFAVIARLWSVVLGVDVAPHQVALALGAVKTARLIANPQHLDSWVDLAGYAACGAEIATVRRST